MIDRFPLGDFIARAAPFIRYDLSASESSSIAVAELLALAEAEDMRRWQELSLGYAAPRGAPWLRETIAAAYPGLGQDDILCCAGAQEGLACVMRALLEPGDHAIVVVPIYQPSEHAVSGLAKTTGVVLRENRGWRLDLAEIAAAIRPETRVILTNFPNSPTGATLDPAVQAELVALCRRHGIWLVNDEVYRLTADAASQPPPIAMVYERGVSIDAVSKGLGLPGLRVGWVASRDRGLLERVLRAKSALSSCLAGPSEVLARIALRAAPRLLARNQALARRNRAHLNGFLATHRELFGRQAPLNDAFALLRYHGAEGAEGFALRVVREAGVLVLPSSLWATALGPVPPDYLRFGLGRGDIATALAAAGHYLTHQRRLRAQRGGRLIDLPLATTS